MRDALFDEIINEIESGQSVANSVNKYKVAAQTFFQWCDEDVNKFKRYARAHTKRADALFDKMVDVAVNMPDVNRARLVNDTIKFVCARISPEKYSEKQLFLKKYKLKNGKNKFEVIVAEEPKKAGIDVYNKLIDRDSDDNVVAVE